MPLDFAAFSHWPYHLCFPLNLNQYMLCFGQENMAEVSMPSFWYCVSRGFEYLLWSLECLPSLWRNQTQTSTVENERHLEGIKCSHKNHSRSVNCRLADCPSLNHPLLNCPPADSTKQPWVLALCCDLWLSHNFCIYYSKLAVNVSCVQCPQIDTVLHHLGRAGLTKAERIKFIICSHSQEHILPRAPQRPENHWVTSLIDICKTLPVLTV